jgi:signal transduction histidine kinase
VGIQKAAQRVGVDVAFLERYMEDLLAYSRSLPVERSQERLADVVRAASLMAQETLRMDGCNPTVVAIHIDVPDVGTYAIARELIVLALANILKNAYESVIAKFVPGSPDGRIDVSVRALADEVQVVVRDNGLGLSADDLEQLRAFAPGRKNKAKRHSTGFGLPIAERYVRTHGGRLDLDGRENEGATVTLALPLVQGTEDGP